MHKVKVWDSFVRFYHWVQLVLLLGLWWSIDNGYTDLHISLGLLLLALLATRLAWGFWGSDSARFSQFLKPSSQAVAEIKAELSKTPKDHLGHSALGGYMVVALMLLLLVQLVSGLFNSDDILSDGPLYAMVSESFSARMSSLHSSNFDWLLGFSAVHVLSILVFTLQKRGFLSAMLHGYKHSAQQYASGLRDVRPAFALLCVLVILLCWLYSDYFLFALDTLQNL